MSKALTPARPFGPTVPDAERVTMTFRSMKAVDATGRVKASTQAADVPMVTDDRPAGEGGGSRWLPYGTDGAAVPPDRVSPSPDAYVADRTGLHHSAPVSESLGALPLTAPLHEANTGVAGAEGPVPLGGPGAADVIARAPPFPHRRPPGGGGGGAGGQRRQRPGRRQRWRQRRRRRVR